MNILLMVELAKQEMNISQLAKKSGLSYPTAYYIARGRKPSDESKRKIRMALGLSKARVNYIFRED